MRKRKNTREKNAENHIAKLINKRQIYLEIAHVRACVYVCVCAHM